MIRLSSGRENQTFFGLALDDTLVGRTVDARCGFAIIDLASGDMAHRVRIEGVTRELYDVAFLPGVRSPSAVGFRTDEVKRIIAIAS